MSVKIAEGQKVVRLKCPACGLLRVLNVEWAEKMAKQSLAEIHVMVCPVCNRNVEPVEDTEVIPSVGVPVVPRKVLPWDGGSAKFPDAPEDPTDPIQSLQYLLRVAELRANALKSPTMHVSFDLDAMMFFSSAIKKIIELLEDKHGS